MCCRAWQLSCRNWMPWKPLVHSADWTQLQLAVLAELPARKSRMLIEHVSAQLPLTNKGECTSPLQLLDCIVAVEWAAALQKE